MVVREEGWLTGSSRRPPSRGSRSGTQPRQCGYFPQENKVGARGDGLQVDPISEVEGLEEGAATDIFPLGLLLSFDRSAKFVSTSRRTHAGSTTWVT